jgi:catechol 2,3-dioxygenase
MQVFFVSTVLLVAATHAFGRCGSISAMKLDQIDHVAVWVTDVERSIRWYREVLGLECGYEEWGTYPAMVCAGSTCIALFESAKPGTGSGGDDIAGMRHIAFRVDRANFEHAQSELRDRGIEFTFQDHDIAESVYFLDPDGHELEITTYELSR